MTGIILLDQFTKGIVQSNLDLRESIPVIPGLFSFTHLRNTGVAFGMGSGSSELFRVLFFIILPIFVCFWIAYLCFKIRNGSLTLGLAYTLILGGAIGNLIDRISLGYVVDFLLFYWKGYHFPAFNVADSAITIAAGLLIIDFIRDAKSKAEEAKEVDIKNQDKSK